MKSLRSIHTNSTVLAMAQVHACPASDGGGWLGERWECGGGRGLMWYTLSSLLKAFFWSCFCFVLWSTQTKNVIACATRNW